MNRLKRIWDKILKWIKIIKGLRIGFIKQNGYYRLAVYIKQINKIKRLKTKIEKVNDFYLLHLNRIDKKIIEIQYENKTYKVIDQYNYIDENNIKMTRIKIR